MPATAEELLAEIEQHLNPPTEDEVIAEADSKTCSTCEGSAVIYWESGRWLWYFEHRGDCLFHPDHQPPSAGQPEQDRTHANPVVRGLQLLPGDPRCEMPTMQRPPAAELFLNYFSPTDTRERTFMNDDHATVPLQLLATEWGLSPEELITALGADRVLVDALEIRHVRVADAQQLLTKRNAEAARHREADEVRRAAMDRDSAAQQARLHAIQAQQAPLIASDPSQPALAVMMGRDHNNQLERAGRHFDEYLRIERSGAVGTMTKFTPSPQEG
jgi:hypothetical protein